MNFSAYTIISTILLRVRVSKHLLVCIIVTVLIGQKQKQNLESLLVTKTPQRYSIVS